MHYEKINQSLIQKAQLRAPSLEQAKLNLVFLSAVKYYIKGIK
jgi:hypothetical protein